VLVESGNMPQDVSMLYKSVISERKAMLMLQLTLMAKKSRISAPKLQKALVGISRICESHLATYKVLKHYHSRIASGKQDLQSQRCFYMGDFRDLFFQWFLNLQGSLWKPFAVSFAKYVMKVSEVSSRLSTAVESVQFEMFFCSLLESQRLVLRPCLIEHIHPCLEEVLDQIHVDHFKKVFCISQQLMLGFRIDIFC